MDVYGLWKEKPIDFKNTFDIKSMFIHPASMNVSFYEKLKDTVSNIIYDIPGMKLRETLINLLDQLPSDSFSQNHINQLKDGIDKFYQRIPTRHNEDIINTSVALVNELLESNTSNLESLENKSDIITLPILESDWHRRGTKWGIPIITHKFSGKIAIKGGTAREIVRDLLDLPNGPDHIETLKDFDAVTTLEYGKLIKEGYNLNYDCLTYVNDLNEEYLSKKLLTHDLTINQIYITHTRAIFTKACEESLRTGISELSPGSRDYFGTHAYYKDGEKIISSGDLFNRGIRALIQHKIKGLKIAKHNIKKENLIALGFGSEPAVMIRRLYQKKSKKKYQIIYNLACFMTDLQLLDNPEEIFDQIEERVNNKYNKSSFFKTFDQSIATSYAIDKYAKAVIDSLLGQTQKAESLLESYDISDKEKIILTFEDRKITGKFLERLWKFEDEYLQELL